MIKQGLIAQPRAPRLTHRHPFCQYVGSHIILRPLLTLLDVALQILHAHIKETLLMWGDLANGMDLFNAIRAESDVRGEVCDTLVLVQRRVDVSWLNDTFLALRGLEQRLGETCTSHSHGERRRALAIFSRHNLIAAELHALDVVISLLAFKAVAGLAQQGHDGCAGVSTNDDDVLVRWVGVLKLRDEAGGADDVEGGDAEELLGVVDALGLEDLGGDGDGAVDRVGDDEHVGVGAVLGCGFG